MAAREIRAGRAFVELGVKDRTAKALRAAQDRLKRFGAAVAGIGAALQGVGTSIFAPILAAAKTFASTGDTLNKMALRTGVAVEALSTLGFAAEQSGADLATVEVGLRNLQRQLLDLAKGGAEATQNFGLLGLSQADLAGQSPDQALKIVADRLALVEDASLQAGLAMRIFGRSGTQLLPLLKGGAAGIEALQREAEALGLTISTEDAQAAADLTDQLNRLWRVMKQGVFLIGASIVKPLVESGQAIQAGIVSILRWIDAHRDLVRTVFLLGVGLAAGGVAITAFGLTALAASAAIGALVTAGGLLATVFGALVSPVGLVTAGVLLLGATILTQTDAGAAALEWLQGRFVALRDAAMPAIQGVLDALRSGDFRLAGQIAMTGLELAWRSGLARLQVLWTTFRNALLDGIDFAVAGILERFETLLDGVASVLGKLAEVTGSETLRAASNVSGALASTDFTAAARSRSVERTLAGAAESAELQQELADLADELAKLTERARQQREEQATQQQVRTQLPAPAELQSSLDRSAAAAGTSLSGAARLLGLAGGGESVQDRQANLLESIDGQVRGMQSQLARVVGV